jgi:hypothetical protein
MRTDKQAIFRTRLQIQLSNTATFYSFSIVFYVNCGGILYVLKHKKFLLKAGFSRGVNSGSNRHEYQEYFLGGKGT